jgi:mitochondrial fission protein ELM1
MTSPGMPLRLLLIREARPGHFNQVDGVALAIGHLREVVIERLELRPRVYAGGLVREWIFRHLKLDRAWLLDWLFGIRLAPNTHADIVVASSRKSLVAGSLIARLLGARLIVSGFLEGYDPKDYDLMLVQSPRFSGEPNCVYSPLPSTAGAMLLPPPRPLLRPTDFSGARATLLVGGAAGSYRLAAEEWRRLAALVSESGRRYGLRWSVSTSRRTPRIAVNILRELDSKGELERFVDFTQAGLGSNAELFDADLIAVTEDSRSMSAEAVATGRPVVLLRPRRVRFSMATEEIAAMAAGGGVVVLPIETITPERFVASVLSIKPSRRHTLDAVAAAIAPFLGLTGPEVTDQSTQ